MNSLFKKLGSYEDYLKKYPIHSLFNTKISSLGSLGEKIIRPNYYSVDPNLKEPFSIEIDDLIRLHYLIISRKVTTILEFGVGKSTVVFDYALTLNKTLHADFVKKNLRRSNSFECHTIDNSKKWLENCKASNKTDLVSYNYSECETGSFNGRTCTFYKELPNICPDFIYLDGPDQFSPHGSVRGVNTAHPDRMPMAADLLSIEHFLLPGTLIVIDGRTANARFLKSNFQRNWCYWYAQDFDQHFFELTEEPIGIYNKRQIDYCLGDNFYKRVKNLKF